MTWIKEKNHIKLFVPLLENGGVQKGVQINIHFLEHNIKSIIAWGFNWPFFYQREKMTEDEAKSFCEEKLLPAMKQYIINNPFIGQFYYGSDFKL